MWYALGIQYANIKEKCYFVTYTGANMKSEFRKLLWLPCSCHILNVVPSNTFKSLNDANIVVTAVDDSRHQKDLVSEKISFKEEKEDESFFNTILY